MEESVAEEREADCCPIKALGKPVWVLESSVCWGFSSQPGSGGRLPVSGVELKIGSICDTLLSIG